MNVLYVNNPSWSFIFCHWFDLITLFTFIHFTVRITIYIRTKSIICYFPRLIESITYVHNSMQLVKACFSNCTLIVTFIYTTKWNQNTKIVDLKYTIKIKNVIKLKSVVKTLTIFINLVIYTSNKRLIGFMKKCNFSKVL